MAEDVIVDPALTLIEEGARWSPSGTGPGPWWAAGVPGDEVAAIAITSIGPWIVGLDKRDPTEDTPEDPEGSDPVGVSPVEGIQFWGLSAGAAECNGNAMQLFDWLLGAVRDGAYIASDADRARARWMLTDPARVPLLHGPCLVTGVDPDGWPVRLGLNFESWFTELLELVPRLRCKVVRSMWAALDARDE